MMVVPSLVIRDDRKLQLGGLEVSPPVFDHVEERLLGHCSPPVKSRSAKPFRRFPQCTKVLLA
jgi:hypothetical protein